MTDIMFYEDNDKNEIGPTRSHQHRLFSPHSSNINTKYFRPIRLQPLNQTSQSDPDQIFVVEDYAVFVNPSTTTVNN